MQFHVPSIQTVMFFIQLMMAGYFVLTWWTNRSERSPLFFAAANIVGAVSALMFLYQAHIHLFFSSIIPILCMVGLISAHFMGVCDVMGRPKPWRTPVVVVTLVVAWATYFAFIEPTLWLRYMAVGVGVTVLCIHTALHLRAMVRETSFVSLRLLLGGVCIHAAFFALSLVSVGITRPTGTYDSLSSTSAGLAITESVLLVVALNIAVAMLFQERAAMRLKRAASSDTLTGLPNRMELNETFERLIHAHRKEMKFAVVLVDLDGFKDVNDTLGHAWGDRLLVQIGERLVNASGSGAVVGRLGGDEFALLIPDLADEADLQARITAMLAALRIPLSLNGLSIKLSGSIGVSFLDHSGQALSEHLRRADIAMYAAKSRGRDRAVTFTPDLDDEMHNANWLRTELRKATDAGALPLVYQPKFDVSGATPKLIGVEALMRWTHPERGVISPAEFIPIAEQTGLIHRLGARSLEQACSDAVALGGVPIAVNLSPAQMDGPDIVSAVAQALRLSGLAPDRLELEITESVFLKNDARTSDTLRALKALGVRLALDDFGTGYSSLSYLTSHPFDTLKIDRSFVRDCVNRPDAQAVMQAVMQLARAIGLDVVAEGVETEEELACVRRLGCTQVQGYLLGRPQHRDALEERLAGWTSAPVQRRAVS